MYENDPLFFNNNVMHPGELVKYEIMGGVMDGKKVVTEGDYKIFFVVEKFDDTTDKINLLMGPGDNMMIDRITYSLDVGPDGYMRYYLEKK